jgi:two-component system NtrC family sensor kinase
MPREAKSNPYGRIRVQMFFVLLAFGLIPLLVAVVAGIQENRRAAENRMRGVLEAMVKNRKVTVELFLEQTMRQLELTAQILPADQLARPEVLERLHELLRARGGAMIDLGFIADDGRHAAYVGPYALQSLDYSAQPWFAQVMVHDRYMSDIFLGFRRFPHMVMAVKKREQGRSWILRATVDTDLLSALVREGGLESGSDVFILNAAGEYQTEYSRIHKLMERSDLGVVPAHSGVRVTEVKHDGVLEIRATGWLREHSWVLVARQQVPTLWSLRVGDSILPWVFAGGIVLILVLSRFFVSIRIRQFRDLENEQAASRETIAHTQKMAAVGRLAAGVAHEINNPLAIIQAQVGVLADIVAETPEMPSAAEFRERIGKIEAQVERGRKVTHRLLGFSRRVGPEHEPVNVVAALDETVGFVEKELEASNIRLVRDYAQGVPIIRSSLAQMQQVFLNLINNALDAMGGEGELRLSVQLLEKELVVRVADTGHGIPEKELSKVFEPFFSKKDGARGHTGLGLAICQDIMRGLGGRISVESAVGRGTVFSIWFPLEDEGG